MQSKNAIGNLINRYKAVLKKCNLINTFGALALYTACMAAPVFGDVTQALAAAYNPTLDVRSAYVVEEKQSGKLYYKEFTAEDGKTYGVLIKDFIENSGPAYDNIAEFVADQRASGSRIDDLTGVVNRNFVKVTVPSDVFSGGAIYGYYKDNVDSITGHFVGIKMGNGSRGGAIYLDNTNVGTLIGNFVGNEVHEDGGAIRLNSRSKITTIFSDFIENKTGLGSGHDGGAISVGLYSSIVNLTGDFIGNQAYSGGAIVTERASSGNGFGEIVTLKGNFIGNSATNVGGAISNFGSIGTISGNFIDNTATNEGGAIYTSGDLTFKADGQSYLISGNQSGSELNNAIYFQVNDGTRELTFDLHNGGSYTLDDKVEANEAKKYSVIIKGDGENNNIFYLNNNFQDTSSITVDNAELRVNDKINTIDGNLILKGVSTVDGAFILIGAGASDSARQNIIVEGEGTIVTMKDSITLGEYSGLEVTKGTLDVTGAVFAVHDTASTFNVGADGTLKIRAVSFGTIGQDGSLTGSGIISKQLTNDGELVLTGLGFETMSKIADFKLQSNLASRIGGSGEVTLQHTSGSNVSVDTNSLYSLTWVDASKQLATDNIMAGTLNGQTVTAAGIVINTEESNLEDSIINVGAELTLTGNNAGNVLLAQGSVTNSGTLNLGVAGAPYTAYFNDTLNTTDTGTTNVLSTVDFSQTVSSSGELNFEKSVHLQTLNVTGGTTTFKDVSSFANANVSGGLLLINSANKNTVTTANGLTIENAGGLNVQSGVLDVTGGTVKVDAAATTFTTGVYGTLIVNGSDFGEFFADGTSTLNSEIGQKLNNNGSLHLEGVDLGTIEKEAYELLLAAVDTDISNGTVKFGNTTVNVIFSLDDIPDASELDVQVKAGTLANPKHVKVSHLIAADGGTTASSIETGAKLTLTGNQNTTLSLGNITNAGELILGTSIADSARGTIQGDLITNANGETTANSALMVTGTIQSTGGTSTFEKDVTANALNLTDGETTFDGNLEVSTTSMLGGGTNNFNGTSSFLQSVTNSGGTNTFNGDTTFTSDYAGASSATFNGVTQFQGTYSNTGTSTITNATTFDQQYTGTGTLNILGGENATNFATGYDSAGILNVGDASGVSGKVTIGANTTMNVDAGGTLNIVNGVVDVSNGTLIVANDVSTTFTTATSGTLKAKASDFATFTNASGIITTSDLLQGNVKKQLNNAGRLILTGQSGAMDYVSYESLLNTTSGLISGGTLQLENVSISTAKTYLEDIVSSADLPSNVVLGNDTTNPDGGTFAVGKIAILGGVNGDMNNLGTLTLTGEGDAAGVLVAGNATNSAGGILKLQDGNITGNLTNSGTVNIAGNTIVNTDFTNTSNTNVQNATFTVMGEATLSSGTLRITGSSGNDIKGASAAFLHNLPSIDGNIIVEQNAYTVLGGGDRTYTENIFTQSGHDWGTDMAAALFIVKPQTLAGTGSIWVDGSKTGLTAATANNAVFAANSLLVVDAIGVGASAALTSTDGKLTVESGAKLHVTGAKTGSTVTIVDGFKDAGSSIATGGWDEKNLTTSSTLQVAKVADFNASTGSYSVEISGNSSADIRQSYPIAQESTIGSMTNVGQMVDVNSLRESIRFFSTLADSAKGIGTNNPRQTVQIWESALQMASGGASAFMSMGASYGAANTILAHLSQSGFGSISTAAAGGQAPAVVHVGQKGENTTGMGGGSPLSDERIKNGLALWLSPMYKYSTVQGVEAGAFKHGYDTSMGGLALGADYAFNNAFRVGMAFNLGTGYTESTGDLSQTQNNFDFWGLSLYGAYYKNNFSLMADVGFTSVFGEINQDVPSILGSSSLEAKTQSTVWTAGLTAEYTFKTDFMDITPHAGVRYMYVNTEAYDTENGRGTIAQTESDNQGVWYFPVGMTFSKDFESVSGWTFTPKLDVGFIAAAGDLHATSVSSIPGVAGNTEYTMQNVDGFAFNGGVGFDLAHKDNGVSVGLNYNIQASEHETGHMLNATFRFEF